MQEAFDTDKRRYSIKSDRWYPNATEKGVLAYKMILQTGIAESYVDVNRVSTNFHLFFFPPLQFPPLFLDILVNIQVVVSTWIVLIMGFIAESSEDMNRERIFFLPAFH